MTTKIHRTDPLTTPISVRDFTTNSTIHPLTTSLDPRAVEASTSICLNGKGAPYYGERVTENFVQMLENFSGSTIPTSPLSGQLWFARNNFLRTTFSISKFWKWNGSSWTQINETLAPYSFSSPNLVYTETDNTHPLYNKPVICQYTTNSTIDNPNTPTLYNPNHILKIFDGANWKEIGSVAVGATPIHTPTTGQMWFDSSSSSLKVYTGSSWSETISNYLPLSGGTITNDLTVNGFITTLQTTPTLGNHVATKSWVESYVTAGTSTLSINDLDDVIITSPITGQTLSFNGTDWINSTSSVDWSNISSIPSNVTNLQSLLDDKLSLTGGTLTGPLIMSVGSYLNMGTNTISNISNSPYPASANEAASVGYVDVAISNYSVTATGGNVTGGGPLSAVVLNLEDNGVTPGTYKSVTVDAKGRVTVGTNPTTLAGYGITNAQPLNSNLTNISTSGITLSGDITGTGSSSIATTLSSTGVSAGTYTSVTVDIKGRVTSGSNPTPAIQTSIANGNSSVSFSGVNGDARIFTNGTQKFVFDTNGHLTMNTSTQHLFMERDLSTNSGGIVVCGGMWTTGGVYVTTANSAGTGCKIIAPNVPKAFGRVTVLGTLADPLGDFVTSVSKTGTGAYTINFAYDINKSTIIASLGTGDSAYEIRVDGSALDHANVRTYDSTGTLTDSGFYFVIGGISDSVFGIVGGYG